MNSSRQSHGWVLIPGLLCLMLGAAPLPPTSLRVNDAANPVGIDAVPYFGWFVNDPDKGEIQTKYQILVASSEANLDPDAADLWNSGEVSGRGQNHIAYGGKALAGDGQYFWKVRTWDKDGDVGSYSEPAKFVVGPISNADWSGGMWIRRDTNVPDDYTYYRKKVSLPLGKTVARATLFISTVHKYALYVNGTLIGKGPAYQYPQYQYYNGYDITRALASNGENVFAIFNHWFGGGQGRAASARGVLMKAFIHYSDGTSAIIGTDRTWKQLEAPGWLPGQGQHNAGEGVGFIEQIDGQRLIPRWNTVTFNDTNWAAAVEIGALPVQPWVNVLTPDLTRIEESEIAPASVADKGNGKYLVDLGKVYAGVPKINFSGGTVGTVVNMQGGYGLTAAGDIDPKRNQSTNMAFSAILSGKEFVYQPEVYLGMRYFLIENSPMPVTTDNFKFVQRHNAMSRDSSSFASSDATLTAVWDLMKHSIFTCAQEEFVDTPTREKGGFLGDGAIQSTVAMPVLNERLLTNRVIREFIRSMEQHWSTEEDRGRMNAVYPNNDGARDIPDFTQAYLNWAWEYYMQTGDKQFLTDNFAHFKEIADYAHRYLDAETGLIKNLRGGSGQYQFGIIDWPASMRFGYDMTAARSVVNEWAYVDCDIISKIAAEIGNVADRDAYRQRAEALKAAINGKLINSGGVYVDGLDASKAQSQHVSQQANMFPLATHIVPQANVAAVKAKVKELKMSVGMVTVMWLVKALGEADEGAHLIDLYTNAEWNGWARTLARGGTATWETWNSDTDGQSESHAWGAAGLYGYVNYILGITPLKPQYEQVRIKPLDFGARLTSAKGTIPTDRGDIAVDWNRSGERYTLNVTIPANVTANVYVPKGAGADASIQIDGAVANGAVEGNYVLIANVGSGAHIIVRTVKAQ